MKRYQPRRAGKQWLEKAPAYVLDCFDEPSQGDRYTVFLGGDYVNRDSYALANPTSRQGVTVAYLGMNAQPTHPAYGVSQWGELDAVQQAAYRFAKGHRRVRWLDLPAHIRAHVIARAKPEKPAKRRHK